MVYMIFITFDSSKLQKKDLIKHLLKHIRKERILELKDYKLKMLLKVPPEEGLGELENMLYYLLDGGELGVCTSYSKV